MRSGPHITTDDLFKTIQEAISNDFDIDTSLDDSFADIPTHNKMIFTQGTKLFIISISEGTTNG